MAIYEAAGWCCAICGEQVSKPTRTYDDWGPTLDHIIPRAAGGTDEPSNLRLTHSWCNSMRRDDKLSDEAVSKLAHYRMAPTLF